MIDKDSNAVAEISGPESAAPAPIETGGQADDYAPIKDNNPENERRRKDAHDRRAALLKAEKSVSEREAAAKAKGDDAAKGKDGDKGTKAKVFDPNPQKDAELRRGALERAFKKVGEAPKPLDRKEFAKPDVRELRAEIKGRYPNVKLADLFKRFESWHDAFKRDPLGTREQLMQHYLQMSPQNFRKVEAKELGRGVAGSIERAVEDSLDLRDLEDYANRFGADLPHLLRQLVEFDRGLIDDPVGMSARLAGNYGALRPPQPQQQHQQQSLGRPQGRTAEQDASMVQQAVEKILQHKDDPSIGMPDIAEAGVLDAMADALMDGTVPRTADRMADLKAAYAAVTKSKKPDQRGRKSISGAPMNGEGAGKQQAPSKTVREALQRAAGGR